MFAMIMRVPQLLRKVRALRERERSWTYSVIVHQCPRVLYPPSGGQRGFVLLAWGSGDHRLAIRATFLRLSKLGAAQWHRGPCPGADAVADQIMGVQRSSPSWPILVLGAAANKGASQSETRH